MEMERDKNSDKSDTFYQPRFSFICRQCLCHAHILSTSFNMPNSKEYITPNLINLRALAGLSKIIWHSIIAKRYMDTNSYSLYLTSKMLSFLNTMS